MQMFSEGVRGPDLRPPTTSSRLLQPFKRPGIVNSEAAAAAHAPASPFAVLIHPPALQWMAG